MIRFHYYKGVSPDNQKEKVATHVCNILRDYLDLPDVIEIEFVQLGPSTYAETIVDYRYPNKMRVNLDLSLNDIVLPIIHELLHLEQIKKKRLTNTRFGDIIWENKVYKIKKILSYRDYLALPWEEEVARNQQKMLEILLKNQ